MLVFFYLGMNVFYKYWDGMYYEVKGSGPAMVLLHGYCDDHSIWKYIEGELEKHYTLIMPDMPGFGKSEICEPQTVETMAEAVKSIIDAEHITEVVMIGHSMGGYITLAFAEKYPQYLKGVGLFHSNAIADTDEKKENRNKTIEFVKQNGVEPFARTFVPNLFAPNFSNDELRDETFNKANSCTANAVIETAKALRDRPDRKKVLADLACPVLFLAGKQDAIIPYSLVLTLAHIPHFSALEVLDKSGHMGMLEQPAESIAALTKFASLCFDRK